MSDDHLKTNQTRRERLQKSETFLRQMFNDSVKNRAARLLVAKKTDLVCLLYVMHYIAIGEIEMKRANLEAIKRSKRLPQLKNLKHKSELIRIKNLPHSELVTFLKKFLKVFNYILHPLFNVY